MPNFAANISMMFNEYDFLDRFAAASKSGFKAVEFLFPYDYEPTVLKEKLIDSNLDLALFNISPGDWEKNERGLGVSENISVFQRPFNRLFKITLSPWD